MLLRGRFGEESTVQGLPGSQVEISRVFQEFGCKVSSLLGSRITSVQGPRDISDSGVRESRHSTSKDKYSTPALS